MQAIEKTYSELTDVIKNGDLLAARGLYPFSWLIRTATSSPWSHVGVLYYLQDLGGWFVAESVESIGVRLVPLKKYFFDYRFGAPYNGDVYVGRFRNSEDFRVDEAMKFVGGKLGKDYDNLENLKIAWELLSGYTTSDMNKDAFNCAEFAKTQYQAGGKNIGDAKEINIPKSIVENPYLDLLFKARK